MTREVGDRDDTTVFSVIEDLADLVEPGNVTGAFAEPVRGERAEESDEVATEANRLDEFVLAVTQVVGERQEKKTKNNRFMRTGKGTKRNPKETPQNIPLTPEEFVVDIYWPWKL
jgi:hypothetical protein